METCFKVYTYMQKWDVVEVDWAKQNVHLYNCIHRYFKHAYVTIHTYMNMSYYYKKGYHVL